MLVAVPTEVGEGERRVAVVPETVGRLTAAGLSVCVQAGGAQAAYAGKGPSIEADAGSLLGSADAVLKVAAPVPAEIDRLGPGTVLIGFLNPVGDPDRIPGAGHAWGDRVPVRAADEPGSAG